MCSGREGVPCRSAAIVRAYQGVFQPQLLVHALGYDLSRPFLYYGDGQMLTAGGYGELVSQYLQALRSLGLRRGARIGVYVEGEISVSTGIGIDGDKNKDKLNGSA